MKKQPWIYSSLFDGIFIILPPFISLLIIFLFPSLFINNDEISTVSWVILVLMIDVAHVYSTLYRTYFDKHTFNSQKNLLITIPLFSFITGVLIYSLSPLLFWRILAYLAVFHFVRQQYGFMRIYSRGEEQSPYGYFIDKLTIYTATLYPIIYWHLHAPRNFNWFIPGDFFYFNLTRGNTFLSILYYCILLLYFVKELTLTIQEKRINIPRNLLIIGTILSWYFGIVYFNGDLSFTLLNVVSHGIPYMALVWIHGKKKSENTNDVIMRTIYTKYGWLLFITIIIGFAYFEEGLWDSLVWNEHGHVFKAFKLLPQLTDASFLSFIIPLLAVPQMTHYIIDGYIWKIKNDKFGWKKILLGG